VCKPGEEPKIPAWWTGALVSPLQSLIFDEVDLSDASVAETSTKNINNSFTVREVWVHLPCPPTSAPRGEALQTPSPPRAAGHPAVWPHAAEGGTVGGVSRVAGGCSPGG